MSVLLSIIASDGLLFDYLVFKLKLYCFASDTLVKLMEYGDEDDDPDETSTESLNSSTYASRKPFWAI